LLEFQETKRQLGTINPIIKFRLKGRTVMNEFERTEAVRHCKWVDEVICPCPWIITLDFVERNNIDYVAHDDLPYGSSGSGDIYEGIKKAGKFLATQRTDGVSTSDIIMRIIKDYDKYIWRSLDRGISPKDLGISSTKAFSVRVKEKIIPKLKERVEKIGDDIGSLFDRWKRNSSHFVDHFVHQFDKDYKPKKELIMISSPHHEDDEISDFDY
jgi:choline-phosphate cytidylyltransferase